MTESIIGGAIAVHRAFGPGLLESVYQKAMLIELRERELVVELEKELPLAYRGVMIGGYRIDMMINGSVIVEIKSVERLHRIHDAQLLTYLRLTGCTVGLLLNFNVPCMKEGIRRLILTARSSVSSASPR